MDSSLVAAIAVDALGSGRVTGVAMPSCFSSGESLRDARELCDNLGINLITIPIDKIYKSYLETLEDVFSGIDRDTTEENIQARIRGNLLMALSNKFRWLVLTTGNKSEMATGYTTLYGDNASWPKLLLPSSGLTKKTAIHSPCTKSWILYLPAMWNRIRKWQKSLPGGLMPRQ
jgi:NAD+ synthetase